MLYGQEDPGVACQCHDAMLLWLQGYPEQAKACMEEALQIAAELGNPHSFALAMAFATYLHQFSRDVPACLMEAEGLVTLATEEGFPHWVALSTVLQGWCLAQQSHGEGLAELEYGLNAWRKTGARLGVTYFLALEAEAHEALGQFDDARVCVAEAHTLVHRTGQRWWLPELSRLEGGLLLVPDGNRQQEDEAEACFHHAIEVAREQEAKMLELRAAVSLSRLWQRQGKGDDAEALLGEISHWFTEGFTTADLQEANALLKELGG